MTAAMSPAAVGFSVHTGWAAAVAVGGTAAEPVVLERARLEMEPAGGIPRFVFHWVENKPLAEASRQVEKAASSVRALAREALERFAAAVEAKGSRVQAAGLSTAAGKPLPALEAILRSHSLIHAAEGELYRGAMAAGCEALGLSLARVPRKTLSARAAEALGRTEAAVKKVVDGMGKVIGPPWSADQKEAMTLAWIALAGVEAQAGGERGATGRRPARAARPASR